MKSRVHPKYKTTYRVGNWAEYDRALVRRMVGARVRRQQVAYARRRGLSSRRACAVLSVARSTLGYESRLRQRDAPALAVMRELAGQYPRYGYRKIRVFRARRGHPMSAQRAYRLCTRRACTCRDGARAGG